MTQPKLHILVVEDDPAIASLLEQNLLFEGYQVSLAYDGKSGLEKAEAEHPALILLDLMLPRMSGLEVCKHLRAKGNKTPIIMVTARDQSMEKVRGLRLGADDYIAKPFDLMELLARIEAVLRRTGKSQVFLEKVQLKDIVIDFGNNQILKQHGEIPLSRQEALLLKYLIHHEGQVLERSQILADVWGHDYLYSDRTIDTHITKLRQKIEPNPKSPCYILTVHRVGYKFVKI